MDIVWPRATHIVWLNYSFPIIFSCAATDDEKVMDKGDIVFWKSGVLADAVLQTGFYPSLGLHYLWQASEGVSRNIEKIDVRTCDSDRLSSSRRGGRVPGLKEK